MNKFLCLTFVLVATITVNCLGNGHHAYVGFKFYNSLDKEVRLEPETTEVYEHAGFEAFVTQVVRGGDYIWFDAESQSYKSCTAEKDFHELLKIKIMVGTQIAGYIKFTCTSRPDPRVNFETKEDSGFKLQQKISRFGGGPTTIEIVRIVDR